MNHCYLHEDDTDWFLDGVCEAWALLAFGFYVAQRYELIE